MREPAGAKRGENNHDSGAGGNPVGRTRPAPGAGPAPDRGSNPAQARPKGGPDNLRSQIELRPRPAPTTCAHDLRQ